jgi:hypothetical protein
MDDMEDDVALIECAICKDEHPEDDIINTQNHDLVCTDCSRICESCDCIYSINDDFGDVDGNMWCYGCIEEYAHWCEREDEYTRSDTYYIQDRGESWCSHCADNYATWCEDCDEYNESGCGRDCDEDSVDGERIVHDYSYRPDPIFHSTDNNSRLFFGMEIEVEAENYDVRRDAAQYAHSILEEQNSLAYLKNDGSLNCGFEVVTHPMTYDFFMNEAQEFWETIDALKYKFQMKSWATRTCGLHIHISRSGFNGPAHTHRFLNLIYSNQAFYQEMAGRSASSWAKFDDATKYDAANNKWVKSYAHKVADPTTINTDRYSAVNTNNRATLEMRIFKGSINTTNVRGALGLAHASVEYTRTMSLQEVKDGGLTTAKFIDYINSKPELYADVITRMGKCPSIEAFMLYNRANQPT